jgi:chemotaxis protein CheX
MAEKLEQEHLAQMIRKATDEVFSTMLGVAIKADAAYVEQVPPEHFDGVVSFIGLAGAWAGTGSLCCSSKFACSLSSTFLMTECAVVDEQVLDAIGELTNMIIGNVKNEVEEHLGPIGLSIPTVIHGRNFAARSLGRDAWTVVPFWCGADRLDVKICLTPKEQAANDHGTRTRAFILP